MNELTQRIAGLITTADVLDYAELRHGEDEVSGAIEDAVERLAHAAEDAPLDEIDIDEALDGWRCEFTPPWAIYTGEAEEVIAGVGLGAVMGAHWDVFGCPAGTVEGLIGCVARDLAGAVVAAFGNADWGELVDELQGEAPDECDGCGRELDAGDDRLCDECAARGDEGEN